MCLPIDSKRFIAVSAAFLVICASAGCADITEHSEILSAELRVYSADDLSLVASIPELRHASSMLVYPGKIFVATTDGMIKRYNAETLELEGSFPLGDPSPSGWNDMVLSTLENTAYVIGTKGSIVEISLPDCQVVDEFSVCATPVDLDISPWEAGVSPGYLWVIDGGENRIYQVKLTSNIAYGSNPFPTVSTCTCMTDWCNEDTMLVGTTTGLTRVIAYGTGDFSVGFLGDYEDTVDDMARLVEDTVTVVVHRDYSGYPCVGILDFESSSMFSGQVSIQGSYHVASPGADDHSTFVLSYLGDGMSRIIKYDTVAERIVTQTDISGYPIDVQTGGTGLIYVLTCD